MLEAFRPRPDIPLFTIDSLPPADAVKKWKVNPARIDTLNLEDVHGALRIIAAGILDKEEPRPYIPQILGSEPRLFDPIAMIPHYGRIVRLGAEGACKYLRTPPVYSILDELEKTRTHWFRMLRGALGSPEDFADAFSQNPSERFAAIFRDRKRVFINLADFSFGSSSSELIAALPPHIICANLLITYLRRVNDTPPKDPLGWHTGRMAEMQLLSARIPPQSEWAPWALEMFMRFYGGDLDIGGFALPGSGRPVHGEKGDGQLSEIVVPRRTHDPERLLFSMGLPSYRELRSLAQRNPYDYVAIVFTEDRVVLDTARIDNRLFCLKGELCKVLELSQQTKEVIRNSPLCVSSIVHDIHARWQRKLADWLDGSERR